MTVKERIARRRKRLLSLAVSEGWKNWSEFETAILHGEIGLPKKPAAAYNNRKRKESPNADAGSKGQRKSTRRPHQDR